MPFETKLFQTLTCKDQVRRKFFISVVRVSVYFVLLVLPTGNEEKY